MAKKPRSRKIEAAAMAVEPCATAGSIRAWIIQPGALACSAVATVIRVLVKKIRPCAEIIEPVARAAVTGVRRIRAGAKNVQVATRTGVMRAKIIRQGATTGWPVASASKAGSLGRRQLAPEKRASTIEPLPMHRALAAQYKTGSMVEQADRKPACSQSGLIGST